MIRKISVKIPGMLGIAAETAENAINARINLPSVSFIGLNPDG
jgi:hypothetical protein